MGCSHLFPRVNFLRGGATNGAGLAMTTPTFCKVDHCCFVEIMTTPGTITAIWLITWHTALVAAWLVMFHLSFPAPFAVSMRSTSEYNHPRRTLVGFFSAAIYRNSTPITRKHDAQRDCEQSFSLMLMYSVALLQFFSAQPAPFYCFAYVLNSSTRKTPEFFCEKSQFKFMNLM